MSKANHGTSCHNTIFGFYLHEFKNTHCAICMCTVIEAVCFVDFYSFFARNMYKEK
jgi:hypothetical protein